MQNTSTSPVPAAVSGPEPVRPSLPRKSALQQIFASEDLRRLLPWLGLAACIGNVLALALPLAILQIMDRVLINQSTETLALMVLGVVLAIVFEEVLRSANGMASSWLGARFEHKASITALRRLMDMPLQLYQKEEPAMHAERVLASSKVADFYSGQALLVLFDFPFAIIFLVLIFFIGGWLVLVPLLLLVLFTCLIYVFGGWMQKQVQQRIVLDDRRVGFLNEVFSGISSVKTMMLEALMLRRYEQLQKANAQLGEKLSRAVALVSGMGTLFSQVMIVSVVFAGSIIVMGGSMTPGGLAACMLLSVRSLQPLRKGLSVWMRYQSFVVANERLNEVMNMAHQSNANKPAIGRVESGIELRDINLVFKGGWPKFQDLPPVFKNLNLQIKVGEFIAIRGESGSGKTSLLSMINGMLSPTSGKVLIDGKPIDYFAADSVYREIALLPQSGAIVAGNILENLTMFDVSLNQEALRIAACLGLDQVVSGMKLGYETPLGEGVDETIPAGLRQLIVIIRALVRKPGIILFDEANTSLDMRADQFLRDYFAELKGQCTMILVTHRPSLIALADKVYSLVDGKLVEGVVSANADTAVQLLDGQSLPERPEHLEDVSALIRRQLDEESDLSNCLYPLLQASSWQGRVRDVAEVLPHMVRRLDMSDLCSIMANLGYHPKHQVGNLARLNSRLMPCLFVQADRPAIVVFEVLPNGNLRIFDGGTKTQSEIKPTSISGEIYLFRSEDAKDAALKARSKGSWVGGLLLRMQRHIALIFALTIVGAILSLAPPLFVRSIYDTVLPGSDHVMGTYIALGVLIVIVIDSLLRNLKGHVLAYVGGRSEYLMGVGMFQRIVGLPVSASQGASVSHQVGRVRNLERLRDFFMGPLAMLVFDVPATLIMILALAIINPYVLLVLVLSAVFYGLIGFFSRRSNNRSTNKASHFQSMRWEFLNDSLTDMRTIRLAGAANAWVERYRELSGKAVMANFQSIKSQASTDVLTHILSSVTGLSALALSAYLSIEGHISRGTMLASMMIMWRITGPLQNVFMASTTIARTRANAEQTDRLMRLSGESDTGVVQTVRGHKRGAISFSRVSFRYAPDADPALLGISFTLEPGQFMVITGSVGSGKSSLLKLIERMYVPQAGTVRLDNADIRQLTANDLRSQISYMPQHCELFYGTVAQNLLFVDPSATDAELNWAIEISGLAADIAALPEGIKTRISSSKADQLANGFRQRLSLARTMLKQAPVVLLDEPGSGMDQLGEEALLRCIRWLRGRSTIIMVSHRPGHMKLADSVVLMRQGSMVAMGTYDSIKEKIFSESN